MLSILEPESAFIAFNLNLTIELATLHHGDVPRGRFHPQVPLAQDHPRHGGVVQADPGLKAPCFKV